MSCIVPPTRFEPFSVARYPALNWCGMAVDLEPSAQFLSVFDEAASLAGIGLSGINSKKLSIAPLRKDLTALRLQEINTPQFDFAELKRFTRLRFLEIVDCRTPLDCALLADLPLEELIIEACDEVDNPKDLLALNSLRILSMHGRYRPYAKDMPPSLPEALRAAVPSLLLE